MKGIALEIDQIVRQHTAVINAMSEEEFSQKRAPGKWSKKEILGHLIDSAQNNIQRFVRGQYEQNPKISYSQDDWVRLQDYQQYSKADLLQLWVVINRHLCHILRSMDVSHYQRQCDVGHELHTLHYLAKDYQVHMSHHLNQIEQDISIK